MPAPKEVNSDGGRRRGSDATAKLSAATIHFRVAILTITAGFGLPIMLAMLFGRWFSDGSVYVFAGYVAVYFLLFGALLRMAGILFCSLTELTAVYAISSVLLCATYAIHTIRKDDILLSFNVVPIVVSGVYLSYGHLKKRF